MATSDNFQYGHDITPTGPRLSLDCPCYSDAMADGHEISQETRAPQPPNDANDSLNEGVQHLMGADNPPPYESLVPRASVNAQHSDHSIISIHNGAPIIVKAKELRPGPFGCAGTMRKFTDVIMVSPSMTIHDLKRELRKVYVAGPGTPNIPSLMLRRADETTVMTVQASWGYNGLLFRKSKEHRENVSTENWPRIALALGTQQFPRLKVRFWVESAAEAVYRA